MGELLVKDIKAAVDLRVQTTDQFPQLTDPASVIVHLRLET